MSDLLDLAASDLLQSDADDLLDLDADMLAGDPADLSGAAQPIGGAAGAAAGSPELQWSTDAVFGNSSNAVATLSVNVSVELGPTIQGCSCPMCGGDMWGDVSGGAGAGGGEPPGAPTVTATLQTLANYLNTGFWNDRGQDVRYFNVSDSGTGANNGTILYNMTGFAGSLPTVYGGFSDSNGISENRKAMVREAFAIYEAVLGIDFVETTATDTDVDFFFMDSTSSAAFEAEQTYAGQGGPLDYALINVSVN